MGRECLSRLYIGHLPLDTSEDDFRSFLVNTGQLARNSFSITVKKGYAFMQCCDQATADLVIDRFNGAIYQGAVLCIEPAVSNYSGATVKLGRCLLTITRNSEEGSSDLPGTIEDLDRILATWGGSIVSMEKLGSSRYIVTVADIQTMADLISRCEEMTVPGLTFKAESAPDYLKTESAVKTSSEVKAIKEAQTEVPSSSTSGVERENSQGSRPRFNGPRSFFRGGPSSFRSRGGSPRWRNYETYDQNPTYPWRMLVPSTQVGALIGRGGATIRGITQATGARVNIHTGHNQRGRSEPEKVLSIVGAPENCTAACRQILEVLAQDLSKTFGAELALRLVAYDSLIGRVIGKGGSNITKIMKESNTRIHISNTHDMSRNTSKYRYDDCDRIITIRGSIGGMVQAEAMVTQKLRVSYESDVMHPSEPFPPIGYFHYRHQY